MTGGRASLIWLVVLAAGIALYAGVWLMPHLRQVSQESESLTQLEVEGRHLAARVEELTREVNRLLARPTGQPEPRVQNRSGRADARLQQETAKRLEYARLLGETRDRLSEADSTIAGLKSRIEKLEASLARLTEQNRSLAESAADLKQQLDRANRVIEAMKTQLKDGSELTAKLEARNRALREENRQAEQRLARTAKLIRDLENIQRRRENLLTSIVRRYREVTDEYRSASLRLSNPGQSDEAVGVELSRIQSAVSLAEEDLRELRSLNARAARIRKQLTQ